MVKTKQVELKIHNNTDKSLAEIKAMLLVGKHRNNWMNRSIDLHQDPADAGFVYSIGYRDCGDIVLGHDPLAECMNFRIALDYWANGEKIYTRD